MEPHEPREPARAFTGWGSTQPSALLTLAAMVCLVVFSLRDSGHRARPAGRRLSVANPSAIVPGVEVPGVEVPGGVRPHSRAAASGFGVTGRLLASESSSPAADRPTGIAVDVRGGGVAGVEVVAGKSRAPVAERGQRTDPAGRFALLRGPLEYELRHPDYFRTRCSWESQERLWRLGFGRPGGASLPFLMFPGQRLTGRLRAQEGDVRGASLAFAVEGRRWIVQSRDGAFTSPLVPMMPLRLLVWHPEFCPVTTTIYPTSRADPPPVGLTLHPGRSLDIRVLAQDRTPIAEAEVFLRSTPYRRNVRRQVSPRPAEKWRLVGWTDELGWMRTGWPSTTPFDVRVRAIGYRAAASSGVTTARTSLFLHRTATIRGKAVDARSGLPVELSDVRLESLRDGEFRAVAGARVALDRLGAGGFVLNAPAVAGRYRVSARSIENAVGVSSAIDLDGTQPPEPLLVRLHRSAAFRGIVCGPGGPLAGALVELRAPGGDRALTERMHSMPRPRLLRTTRSAADGSFRLEAARDVLQRLYVKVTGLGEYFSPPFCPPVAGDFIVALQPGATVTGIVKTSGRRSVVVGAEVRLVHRCGLWRSVRTDAAGRYEFRDVPGGRDFELILPAGGSSHPEHDGAGVRRTLDVVPGRQVVYNLKKRETRASRIPSPRVPQAGSGRR